MLFFLIHPSPQMTGFGPFDSEISTMSTVWKWTPTISFTTAVSASSFWFWVKTRTFFAETSQSPSGCLLHIWRNSLEMTLRLTDDPKTRRLCPQLSLLQTHKNKSVVLNSSFRVYLRLWFKCQRQKCVCVCSSLVFQVSSFCPAQLHLIFSDHLMLQQSASRSHISVTSLLSREDCRCNREASLSRPTRGGWMDPDSVIFSVPALLRLLLDIYHLAILTQRSADTCHSWKHTYCSCSNCRS